MDWIPKKINEIICNYLSDVENTIKIEKVLLFGSYAKGSFNQHSNIDIAIFSKDFENKKFVEATTLLIKIARKHNDICIEPIGFDSSILLEDNPFIDEILKTGKEIYIH